MKRIEDMTIEEVECEKELLEEYFRECEKIEQGINSKETVRYNKCLERLVSEQPQT